MNTPINNIVASGKYCLRQYLLRGKGAGLLLLFALCMLTACSSDDDASLNVSGSCLVEELVLNNQYTATINLEKRLIKVKVPVTFNQKADMQITSLRTAPGAVTNFHVGDRLNFESDKTLHVQNGDLVLDYQVSVRNDEAKMTLFLLGGVKGSIDQENKTIKVAVNAKSGIDLSNAVFEVQGSEDAVCSPASGTTGDFTQPFTITLTDNTATTTYTVYVTLITDPVALFVGEAENEEMLNPEEKAAAKWLIGNITDGVYASWDDIISDNISLEKVKFVFFHRHCTPYGTYNGFVDAEKKAMTALSKMKELRDRGVGFVLQRSAVNYAIALGAMPEDAYPNNVWGTDGEGSDLMGADPWTYRVYDINHPLWQNLKRSATLGDDRILTLDEGYTICNTTSQYGFWGDYPNKEAVEAKTGGRALGGDGNVSSWELKAADGNYGKGGIICLGSGVLDWNSPTPYTSNYHDNMGQILLNAYDYLTK